LGYESLIEEIHLTWLSGLGGSYRFKGYFKVRKATEGSREAKIKINFKGVAFGGLYGGHNVNIELSPRAKKTTMEAINTTEERDLDTLLSEVQRMIMQGDMVVDYEKIKPESMDSLGNVTG
jgi:hypothetical protein